MSASSPVPSSRPRVVNVAFWCWLAAALLLVVGGLLTATVNLPGLPGVVRAAGVLSALVGLALAFLAGKSRSGDDRFRRAATALSVATVLVIGVTAVFGVVHILTLLGLLPLIVAMGCITRPAATNWFSKGATE